MKTSREQQKTEQMTLLKELTVNGRATIDELSRKLKISRQKIWRMMKTLEKEKIIIGYHVVVDRNQLDLQRYVFLMKRSIVPMENNTIEILLSNTLTKKADSMDIIIETFSYLHGCFDFSFSIYAKDLKQAMKFGFVLSDIFKGKLSDVVLLEELVPILDSGILHPDRKKLKEYF
jgi:DNA-binding Lrp family transcriptional regulator